MKSGVCPKCQSDQVFGNRQLEDSADAGALVETKVRLYQANPTAMLFKGTRSTRVRAWVCSDCGYTELYCTDLKALENARKHVPTVRDS